MRDQLLEQPHHVETGISNLDSNSGPETHWVAYAIDPRAIVYFDSYGLLPPVEILNSINQLPAKIWYSTLLTQTMTDPSIVGQISDLSHLVDYIKKCACTCKQTKKTDETPDLFVVFVLTGTY